MKRIVVAVAALSLFVFVTGCGQSGPLYLPGNPSKIERIPPAADEEDENKDEKDNDGR